MQLLPAFAHVQALVARGLLAASKATTTTSKPKTSSSGSALFFVFLIIIVGVYFLFIAPQRRKMRAQMNQQARFEVGDEVVTKAGVYGRVETMDGDRVGLEIAPGTTIEVTQGSILRSVAPAVAEDLEEEGSDDEAEEADETDHHEGDETDEGDGWTEAVHQPADEEAGAHAGDAKSGGPS